MKHVAEQTLLLKAGDARWNEARNSMVRLEASILHVSPAWLAGTTALGLSVALLALTCVLASLNLARLKESFAWVQHTQSVLFEVAFIREGLLESASAVRGFVITGDRSDIDAHRQARAALALHLRSTIRLVADNAVELDHARALQALIVARQRLFDDAGGLTPARRQDIGAGMRDPVRSEALRRFNRDSTELLAAFQAAELRLLGELQGAAAIDQANLFWLSVVAAVMALVSGVFGMLLVQRERGEHRAGLLLLELMHAQRVALMNTTSSALAHELNQPLAATANYLAALRRLAEHPDSQTTGKLSEVVAKTLLQVGRASAIVGRLRAFIDKRTTERTVEQPALLVEDAMTLLGTIDESVRLQVHIDPDLPMVRIDRVQIQQVLVNLLRNAIEAMQIGPRRELLLRVFEPAQGTVEVCLADSGSGLSKEIASRLFEPFVTSKPSGMGVGLSICNAIVRSHGGRIWAESNAGGGSVFHFTLPAIAQQLAA